MIVVSKSIRSMSGVNLKPSLFPLSYNFTLIAQYWLASTMAQIQAWSIFWTWSIYYIACFSIKLK